MKRYGNLYEKIYDPENLRQAYVKASRGKRGKLDVIEFSRELETNLRTLYDEMVRGEIVLGGYKYFMVRDPKERLICAAPFRERVLHHAIMNICEPIFEGYSISDSYACRKGKGLKKAIQRAQHFSQRYPFFLKMDIRKYFDSINHNALMGLLKRKFKDRELLELLEKLLSEYSTKPKTGLPIGNLTSQHLANFYLGNLDHYVKETMTCKGYVRYMDDFVVWGQSRSELRQHLMMIRQFAATQLKLSLKDSVQIGSTANGMTFLGFRIFPSKIGLSRRTRNRFVAKVKRREVEYDAGEISEAELSHRVQSMLGFVGMADALGFRKSVFYKI